MTEIENEINRIKNNLEKYFVYTGECEKHRIEKNSPFGNVIFSINSDLRQNFLDEKKSGLHIICSKAEYLIVQLKNVTC